MRMLEPILVSEPLPVMFPLIVVDAEKISVLLPARETVPAKARLPALSVVRAPMRLTGLLTVGPVPLIAPPTRFRGLVGSPSGLVPARLRLAPLRKVPPV